MKKLKLEELEVTSFDTAAGERDERGTVHAHATGGCSFRIACETFACPSTPQMDCTLGCTSFGECGVSESNCVFLTDPDCVAP